MCQDVKKKKKEGERGRWKKEENRRRNMKTEERKIGEDEAEDETSEI